MRNGFSAFLDHVRSQIDWNLGVPAEHHPRGMIDFFNKLDKKHESNPKIGQITKYLSTHPPTPERIRALEEQIATFDLSQPLIMNTQEFERIKGMLK